MPPSSVSVGIVGATGGVGRTFVNQLLAQASWLGSRGVAFDISAVTNSRKMCLSLPQQISSQEISSCLSKGKTLDMNVFMESLQPKNAEQQSVLFDCTASAAIAELYIGALNLGIHVITPNKRLTSAPFELYQSVQQAQFHLPDGSLRPRFQAKRVFYEAAVGAGLPIITTLQDALQTGDEIYSIQGILSGTMSHLFNSFGPGQSFAQLVRDARKQGYTEPDPREDLCGMDVARKVLTLARECGLKLELADVNIQSLLPDDLPADMTTEEFLDSFSKYDGDMLERVEKADAAGCVVRYVGQVDIKQGTCKVMLKEFPKDHAFAQLSGTDNIVSFHSRRYSAQPLTIRGPGAGLEVTAAGIFGDFLRLLRSLGYLV